MITDFKYNEIIFVEIQRVFHTFLAQNGYYMDFYHYWDQNTDRDYDEMNFSNKRLKLCFSFGMIPFQIHITRNNNSFFRTRSWKDGFEIVNVNPSIDSKKYYYDQYQIAYGIFKDFEGYKNLSNILPINNSFNILKSYRDFIEKELMPVLKGEMWIDELLKRKGIKNTNNK